MKEHPIIFSTDMVRAILEGRKTQTRRVIKPQPKIEIEGQLRTSQETINNAVSHFTKIVLKCPYGQVGQRLWVREPWYPNPATCTPIYKANYPFEKKPQVWSADAKWKSSVFMPRWASRINLEITGLRVERLQEITEEDAVAEGIEEWQGMFREYDKPDSNPGWARDPILSYQTLWDSLNAKRGYGWETNPWVWVIEFRYEKQEG